MNGRRKILAFIAIVAIATATMLAGCINEETPATTPASTETSDGTPALMVYCGAGMRKPMDEIGSVFEQKYGVKVEYNYAGSNALLSQMELTQAGDCYMPGATKYIDIATEKGFIDYKQNVCYHIPVITVPKGNPANIASLEDLGRSDVTLVWGDPEVAAIGNTGVKILEKNGLYDTAWPNVIATLPTMNEVMMQIAMGQADASINWWDTVKFVDEIDVVEIPREQNDIKIVPIGSATFSEKKETANQFVDFVASDEGKAIFEQYGFITYPNEQYE